MNNTRIIELLKRFTPEQLKKFDRFVRSPYFTRRTKTPLLLDYLKNFAPDYKDQSLLRRFISSQAKVIDPRYTGTCAKHQRKLAEGIKRARCMALLPFVRR
jgi:ribosomal protein S18